MEPNTNISQQTPIVNPVVNQVQGQLEGPVSLFSSSWQFFKTNWKILVSITIIPMVIIYAGQILNMIGEPVLLFVGFILLMAGIITSVAMQPAAINAIHRLTNENGVILNVKGQYGFGFKLFWSVLLVGILNMFVVMGSGILLLIPLIVVSVYASLCIFTLVLDGKKGFSSFEESYSLVKGRWWAVLGRMLFLGLIYLICAIVLAGISFIIQALLGITNNSTGKAVLTTILNLGLSSVLTPLISVYTYKLYMSLKSTRQPNISTGGFKKWLIAFLVVGVIAMISIPVIGGMAFYALRSAKMGSNDYTRYMDSKGVFQGDRVGEAGSGPVSDF